MLKKAYITLIWNTQMTTKIHVKKSMKSATRDDFTAHVAMEQFVNKNMLLMEDIPQPPGMVLKTL